ncbi:MAG TPA: PilZ domain-containing protein [Spirochaetales bacterium]|nr:PilZ domain-containing protein [Spirochaetales bacterium]
MSTAVSRIEREFILKALVEKAAPMQMRYRNHWIPCILKEVSSEDLILQLSGNQQEPLRAEEKVDVFFKFRGARMTFRTKILAFDTEKIRLSFPQGIYRDLSRGYERVTPPEDVRISFLVQGERVELNFPKSESYDVPEEPAAMANFDASKITNLLQAFREKARELSSEAKIVMFRERKPESFEEQLIAHTGKIFLYPQSINTNVPEKELILSPKILSQEEVILSETNRGKELFEVLQSIAILNREKERKGIFQELFCPILFHQYVVGYLYMVTFKEGGTRYTQKVVEFVSQFSRLLSYSLMVNGYFKGEPVKEKVDKAEIIDISASGILFALPKEEYENLFQLFMDLEFTLFIGGRNLKIGGRIMRKFSDQNHLYIGIMFLDIEEADRLFLLEYLYGTTEVPDFYPSAEEWDL